MQATFCPVPCCNWSTVLTDARRRLVGLVLINLFFGGFGNFSHANAARVLLPTTERKEQAFRAPRRFAPKKPHGQAVTRSREPVDDGSFRAVIIGQRRPLAARVFREEQHTPGLR